jgi:hypothetical protein
MQLAFTKKLYSFLYFVVWLMQCKLSLLTCLHVQVHQVDMKVLEVVEEGATRVSVVLVVKCWAVSASYSLWNKFHEKMQQKHENHWELLEEMAQKVLVYCILKQIRSWGHTRLAGQIKQFDTVPCPLCSNHRWCAGRSRTVNQNLHVFVPCVVLSILRCHSIKIVDHSYCDVWKHSWMVVHIQQITGLCEIMELSGSVIQQLANL